MPALVPHQLGDLPVLLSPTLRALGVAHAFTTRQGGVSCGAYASLNLSTATGDSIDAVLVSRTRLCAALGCTLPELRFCRQVHASDLLAAVDAGSGDVPESDWPAADGIIAAKGGLLAGVRVADCLPVLLAVDDGSRVAAVHAGWRGLVAGIVPAAVARLAAEADVPPQRVVAAVGPGIGVAAYEVSDEVAEQFPVACRWLAPSGRRHVDLTACALAQLRQSGVERVDAGAPCTAAHPEQFFSHRRDGAVTGRQAGVIASRR